MLNERLQESPDLEDLAAYVDGRLSGERKAQVEERLLHDEDFYEVFVETSRFRAEEKARRKPKTKLLRFRPWHFAVPLAALAASFALVVILPRPEPTSRELAGLLDPGHVAASGSWSSHGWTTRGDDEQWKYPPEELAFRIGVRTVDLRIAFSGGDQEAAGEVLGDLEKWTDEEGWHSIAAALGKLRDEIGDAGPDTLLERLGDVEERLVRRWRESPETLDRLRLGQWTEAGRLAALAGDATTLAELRRKAPETADSAELESVLDAFLDEADLDAERFREVAAAFEDAILEFAG